MSGENNGDHKGQIVEANVKLSEFQVSVIPFLSGPKHSQHQYYQNHNFYIQDFVNEIDHPPKI